MPDLPWYDIGVYAGIFLTGVIVSFAKKFWAKAPEKPALDPFASAELHSEIHERLTELRISCNAVRTTVSQFHNGGVFADGSSMLKFSYTHQSVDIGVMPTAARHANVITSNAAEFLRSVWENKAKIRWTEAMSDCLVKIAFQSQHTIAYAVLPFYGADRSTTVGFILVEWDDKDELAEVDFKEMEPHITSTRNIVSALILKKR